MVFEDAKAMEIENKKLKEQNEVLQRQIHEKEQKIESDHKRYVQGTQALHKEIENWEIKYEKLRQQSIDIGTKQMNTMKIELVESKAECNELKQKCAAFLQKIKDSARMAHEQLENEKNESNKLNSHVRKSLSEKSFS